MNDLIFDRTAQDLLDDTDKAYYDNTDLNRVESWCRYLADELTSWNYPISITTKTNWTTIDLRDEPNMNRIRSNIKAIMDGYYYLTALAPNVNLWNYTKANNWEQILYEINGFLIGMKHYFVYSNVANSGQPRLYQNRFRHRLAKVWSDLTETTWSDFETTDRWEDIMYEDNY